MRKLVNDKDLDKTELMMSLFARCSILELLVVDHMQLSGELNCRAMEVQNIEHSMESIETRYQFKKAMDKKAINI